MTENTEALQTERFLVYGTLRPGCSNYQRYFPYVNHEVETVRVPGFVMYAGRGFPYAVRSDAADFIECSLMTVTDTMENIEALTQGLDFLEGYNAQNPANNLYDRIRVEVNGEEAYLYVVGEMLRESCVAGLPLITSGSWYDVTPALYEPYVLALDDNGTVITLPVPYRKAVS